MLICQRCGADFARTTVIEGRVRDLRGRKRCLTCRPFRPLRRPRRPVIRPSKALTCKACGREFSAKQLIDGRVRSLYRRRFCLNCSPFGTHNTSRTPFGARTPDELQRARRQRRTESFRRSLRKRRLNRKRQLVAAQGGRCVDCGYAECLEVFQFHHRDSAAKLFGLMNFSGSLERLLSEAAKCDLLCANCHRKRHIRTDPVTRPEVDLRRRKKQRAIASFGGACQGCGGRYPPTVFEFHHLDSATKEFEIATRGIQLSWSRIAGELAKCVMLCANCHAEVHAKYRHLDVASGAA